MENLWLNLNPVGSFKRQCLVAKSVDSKENLGHELERFPLMKLPAELRLRVLSFTDLVPNVPDLEANGDISLIMDGEKLRIRRPYASSSADGLFFTCKLLRTEATEILLANNTLVLQDCNCRLPDPACATVCLQTLNPGILRRVPRLELRLKTPWLLDTKETDQEVYNQFFKNWNNLLGFIASSFTLNRLAFTLDASWECDSILECGISKERLNKYMDLYQNLTVSLRMLKNLKRLKVYLACHHEFADKIVEEIMMSRHLGSTDGEANRERW